MLYMWAEMYKTYFNRTRSFDTTFLKKPNELVFWESVAIYISSRIDMSSDVNVAVYLVYPIGFCLQYFGKVLFFKLKNSISNDVDIYIQKGCRC